MTPEIYTLQHGNTPQPKLLDADPITTHWPKLPSGSYIPAPRELTLSERMGHAMARWWGL